MIQNIALTKKETVELLDTIAVMRSLKVIRLENCCDFDEQEACESLAKTLDFHSTDIYVFSIYENSGFSEIEIRDEIESEQSPLGSIVLFDRENQIPRLVYPRKVGVSLDFKAKG